MNSSYCMQAKRPDIIGALHVLQLAQAGISHQSWQQEASDRDSWRSSVRKASCEFEAERHKARKGKNVGGRKSEQHPYHSHPKPSSVQSAVGGAHQECDSTATNEHTKIDHQPSQQSPFARNEPSSPSCRYVHTAHGMPELMPFKSHITGIKQISFLASQK